MKASKIRIVVILLLIIFFGLLILFGWSRNIYEGLPKDASFYSDSTKTLDFSKDSGYKIDKITTTSPAPSKSTAQSVLKLPNDKQCYYISIYYFTPKTMPKTIISGPNLPIAFINHNLPDGYNLYFSNNNASAESFGGNISPATTTAVFIEKIGTITDSANNYDDKTNMPTFIVDKKIKQKIAGGKKSLKDWDKESQNDGPVVSWSSRFQGVTRIPPDASRFYLVKVPAGTTKPVPQVYVAASTIPKTSIIGSFNVQYNPSNNTSNLIPDADDKNDNVGLINLVNVYVKLE